MKIRVVLADDHPALLSGVRHDLGKFSMLDVVGCARDSGELMALLSQTPCDVLVTDYAMPGGEFGDGLKLIGHLKRHFPKVRIVVFTTLDSPMILSELSRLGVEAVLGKHHETRRLVSAIHAVVAGARYYPDEGGPNGPGTTKLSKRELEVVRLLVDGQSVNEIAQSLNRSKQTISAQKISAMRKLGIERDADLFRYAYETGMTVASKTGPE